MRTSVVYALECPILHAVFYVGCTIRPHKRWEQHKYVSQQKAIRDWFAELKAMGHEPIMFVLQRVEPTEARSAERRWIEHYSRVSPFLLNQRGLGDGNKTRRRRLKQLIDGNHQAVDG